MLWTQGCHPTLHKNAALSVTTQASSLPSLFLVPISIPLLLPSTVNALIKSGALDNFIDASLMTSSCLIPLEFSCAFSTAPLPAWEASYIPMSPKLYSQQQDLPYA